MPGRLMAPSSLKSVDSTYSAMSRALKTPEVPAIARSFHGAGLLTETRRRNLWDGAIRRNRPMDELRWLCSKEGRQLGFGLDDNCSINAHETGTLSPLGAAIRLRKVKAICTLLDAGAPREPQPQEPNFLTLLLRGVPDKAQPTTGLLTVLQQNQVALDVPGHGSPLGVVLQRADRYLNRFPVVGWLKALAPLKLSWANVELGDGDTLLHRLARNRMDAPTLDAVLQSLPGLTLDMFEAVNAHGLSPLDEAQQMSKGGQQHPLVSAYQRRLAEHRAQTSLDQNLVTRPRAQRWRA